MRKQTLAICTYEKREREKRGERDVQTEETRVGEGRRTSRYKERDNGRRGRAHVKTGGADNNVYITENVGCGSQ